MTDIHLNCKFLKIPVEKVDFNPRNPKKHPEKNIKEIRASMKRFGYINPIVVVKSGDRYELVAGEGRLLAAKECGMSEIPAIETVLSQEESVAYLHADNEIPNSGTIDAEIFAENIKMLHDWDPEADWNSVGLDFHDEVFPLISIANHDINNDGHPEGDIAPDSDFKDGDKPERGKPISLNKEQREFVDTVLERYRLLEDDKKIPEGSIIVNILSDWMAGN